MKYYINQKYYINHDDLPHSFSVIPSRGTHNVKIGCYMFDIEIWVHLSHLLLGPYELDEMEVAFYTGLLCSVAAQMGMETEWAPLLIEKQEIVLEGNPCFATFSEYLKQPRYDLDALIFEARSEMVTLIKVLPGAAFNHLDIQLSVSNGLRCIDPNGKDCTLHELLDHPRVISVVANIGNTIFGDVELPEHDVILMG